MRYMNPLTYLLTFHTEEHCVKISAYSDINCQRRCMLKIRTGRLTIRHIIGAIQFFLHYITFTLQGLRTNIQHLVTLWCQCAIKMLLNSYLLYAVPVNPCAAAGKPSSVSQYHFSAHSTRRQNSESKFLKALPIPCSTANQKLWWPTCAPARTNSWRRHWKLLWTIYHSAL